MVIALAGVGFGTMRAFELRSQREQLFKLADQRASSLAALLAGYLRQTFASADASLRQLALHSQRVGGPNAPESDWTPELVAARAGLTAVGSISVTDRAGVIRHSTQPVIVGQSRANDYAFQRLASDTTDSLVASTPFRAVAGTHPFLIPIGRRLESGNRAFVGAVVATVIPDELRDVFRTADVGAQGMVSVFHRNGFVVIREPSHADPIGEEAKNQPLFVAAQTSGDAIVRARAQAGGAMLRTAYRPVAAHDLIVAVSIDEDDLLAEWRYDVAASVAIGALLFVAASVILALMYREMATRAAAQDALSRSQRMESIGRLSGGIAHDFNNLLSVILGNVELIKEDLTQNFVAETAESAAQIERAATRASALVRQLLAFARRQPLQPRIVDLAQLARDTKPMLDRVLGEDIALTLRIDAEHSFSHVDPVGTESALLNLCVNARDAMPNGGSITVELTNATVDASTARSHTAAAGRYAVLRVTDTGTGIRPEDLARVFEPFFTTKDLGRGTGLGLSIVYGFMKQSGGFATVESTVGRGTTVSLFFPEAEPGEEADEAAERSSPPIGHGETILVVEDEPDLRSLTTRFLSGLGYRVLSAADGRAALDVVSSEHHIDLLLTDIVMPGMSGRALAAELRISRPDLPVVFVSGYSSEDPEPPDRRTPDPVLAKPYDRATLADAVRAALDAD